MKKFELEKEKIKIYNNYKKNINMSYSELLNWSLNPISQQASVKPKNETDEAAFQRIKLKSYLPKKIRNKSRDFNTAQIRNIVLLRTPKDKWDKFLISQANKVISYLSRAKKIKGKNNRRNIIAMKNWAYDKNK